MSFFDILLEEIKSYGIKIYIFFPFVLSLLSFYFLSPSLLVIHYSMKTVCTNTTATKTHGWGSSRRWELLAPNKTNPRNPYLDRYHSAINGPDENIFAVSLFTSEQEQPTQEKLERVRGVVHGHQERPFLFQIMLVEKHNEVADCEHLSDSEVHELGFHPEDWFILARGDDDNATLVIHQIDDITTLMEKMERN